MATYIKTLKQDSDIILPVTSVDALTGGIKPTDIQQNILTASIGTSGSDTQISQNAIFPINSVYGQVGTDFSISDSCIVIGPGITKVLVSASVFFTYRSATYGWFRLEKNGNEVAGTNTIASVSNGSFGTATMSEKLLTVAEGDKLRLKVLNDATYRQLHSYITIKQVA